MHHRAEERNPEISTEEEERELHIYAKQKQSLYPKAKQCEIECEVFAFLPTNSLTNNAHKLKYKAESPT